jgi:predicted N-acetyltransferase YhbS
MIQIEMEGPGDIPAREKLLDACFTRARWFKTCQRLRRDRLPAHGLSFVARAGDEVVGTVRLWHIEAGDAGAALLLGPIAVDSGRQGAGIGAALMRQSLSEAKRLGHKAVLLVGDAPYYERFGFSAVLTDGLEMPGPVARERFLGLELVAGALANATGAVKATGMLAGPRRRVGGGLAQTKRRAA